MHGDADPVRARKINVESTSVLLEVARAMKRAADAARAVDFPA